MECERFAAARVLAAYGEATEHVEGCAFCTAEIDEMREVRRLYAARPARSLSGQSKNRIVVALRRQSRLRRMRLAVMAAVILIAVALAQAGLGLVETANHDSGPVGAVIDGQLREVRDRVSELEWETRPADAYLDAALDDVARRVELLSWDDENM
jgi:hypothetical protein